MKTIQSMIPGGEPNRATRSDCLEMAKDIAIGEPDISEPNITSEAVIMLQLFTHMTINTKVINGQLVNLYSGKLSDGHGVYPLLGLDHPTIDKPTGRFHEDPKTGLLHFMKPGNKTHFVVGDIHRVTENMFLASSHYFAHRLHNKLIDNGIAKDYEHAKRLTIACLGRIFLDIFKAHLDLKYDSQVRSHHKRYEDNEFTHDDVMNTFEVIFGFFRWAHAMCGSKINDIDIFTKNVSTVKSFNWVNTFSNAKGFVGMPNRSQVPKAMTEMEHLSRTDIRDITMTRYCEHEMVSWNTIEDSFHDGDDPRDLRRETKRKVEAHETPVWLGVLEESRDFRPGPITTEVLAACAYNSIWHDGLLDEMLPDGITSGDDIIKFVENK